MSTVKKLRDVLVDNTKMSDSDAAAATGLSKETVRYLRRSDSFRTILKLEYDRKYGDAIRQVEMRTIEVAEMALDNLGAMLEDESVLPAAKLAATEQILENYHKTRDRDAPVGSKAAGGPLASLPQVAISLSFNELQEARRAANSAGKIIELPPGDVVNGVDNARQGNLLPAGSPKRVKV